MNQRSVRTVLSIAAAAVFLFLGGGGLARSQDALPADDDNLLLGNPTAARHDETSPENYLVARRQYALSYNQPRGGANWVSWHVGAGDLGTVKRKDAFRGDPELPKLWRVTGSAYKGSGYDRGHMCPSGDRTASDEDNAATFYMSNMLPQTPDLNRGPWEKLEAYGRELVRAGQELYIIAGPEGDTGPLPGAPVVIPKTCWKVIVALDAGDGDLTRIDTATRVIAVEMPNENLGKKSPWTGYLCTVRHIEQETGTNLLSNLPESVQAALEPRRDPLGDP